MAQGLRVAAAARLKALSHSHAGHLFPVYLTPMTNPRKRSCPAPGPSSNSPPKRKRRPVPLKTVAFIDLSLEETGSSPPPPVSVNAPPPPADHRIPSGEGTMTGGSARPTFRAEEWGYCRDSLDQEQIAALRVVEAAGQSILVDTRFNDVEHGNPVEPVGGKLLFNAHGTKKDPDHVLGLATLGGATVDVERNEPIEPLVEQILIDAQGTKNDAKHVLVLATPDGTSVDSSNQAGPDDPAAHSDFEPVLNAAVEALLEIVPHVDIQVLTNLVHQHLIVYGLDQVLESVVQHVYDNPLFGEDEAYTAGTRLSSQENVEEDDQPPVECVCCAEDTPVPDTVACMSGHSLCKRCIHRYAATQLGMQNPDLSCIALEGCTSAYRRSDLRLALPEKLFSLYERLDQRQELEAAEIDGLEHCPFCDYACIMTTPREESPWFVCAKSEDCCGITSCQFCRKKEHPMRTCDQVISDGLASRLAIEEAMTAAITRQCPRCSNGELSTLLPS